MLDALVAFTEPWANLFANNTIIATAVTVLHVLAIFTGGGLAIAADRRLLRTQLDESINSDDIRLAATELATAHRLVLVGLASALVTGLLLLASDIGTFAVSQVFWIKMSMIVLLLANGLRMRIGERRVLGHHPQLEGTALLSSWKSLRQSAVASFIAWLVIVSLGVVLVNI